MTQTVKMALMVRRKQVAGAVDIASPSIVDDVEEEEEPNDGVEANSVAELVKTMSDCLGTGKMELGLEIEMLCLNPARRISALDALAHAYFKNDDDDDDDDGTSRRRRRR